MEAGQLDENKYIVFHVGEQLMALSMMTVREVIECPEIKPVPNSKEYFSGVCNVRGQVVAVLDLRNRLNLQPYSSQPILLIFELSNYVIAAKVDKLVRVDVIKPQDIDEAYAVQDFIDQNYVEGIYRLNNEVVTIIDIKKFLVSSKVAA